eukprot:COSAG01_NODE_3105_length_6577_cov_4.068077_3_plen_167_part_00
MARCPMLGLISIARTHTARRDNAQALLERFLQLSEALKDARGKGDALMFLGKLASERSGAVTPRSPDHPHNKRSPARPKYARPRAFLSSALAPNSSPKIARLPLRSRRRVGVLLAGDAAVQHRPPGDRLQLGAWQRNPLLPRPVRPTLQQRRLSSALRGVASRSRF